MEQTLEYKNGTYIGEVKDGIPHGKGILKIDNNKSFNGHWKNGKRHGFTHYSNISIDNYDGLETTFILHQFGEWTDDVLSGVVWEYIYEDDMSEKTTEYCVFQDEYGLFLLGIDREGKIIGSLAKELTELEMQYDRKMLCYNGNLSWGKALRDGHMFIGQFSSEKEKPYYAEDYLPHGFCIEVNGDELIYCGMFEMGKRKGLGVVPSTDSEKPFKLAYQIT